MTGGNISCILTGPGQARFEDRPLPQIEDPKDVIIRMSYVGVCGSDVHYWCHAGMLGRLLTEANPVVMGHEGSGIVDSVGKAVTTLKPGDKVAIEPQTPCRSCKHCKGGKYHLCQQMVFASDPPHDGLLAKFVKVPEDFAFKLEDGMSLQEGALIEPLAVAVHGARLASLTAGQTVLILGAGTIGLLSAAVASAYGAHKVCIVDINSHKLEFARGYLNCATFSPDLSLNPEDNAAKLKQECDFTHGVDVVLECTGVESSAQTGLYAAASGSSFIQIGMGKALQALPISVMGEKEIAFKASFRYGPGDYQIALDLVASGKVAVKPLISNVVPFERATDAWEMTKSGDGIKNQIEISSD